MSIQTNSPSTNLGTSVSADGIRAAVTGTAGAGKPIVDDNAGGLEWGAVPQTALSSGNKLGLAAGGTNANLSATGGATHVLRQASAGAAITVGALVAADIPSTLNATTFGGHVALDATYGVRLNAAFGAAGDLSASYAVRNVGADCATIYGEADTNYGCNWVFATKANTGSGGAMTERFKVGETATISVPLSIPNTPVSVGTSFTTIRAVAGNQALMIATVTGLGSILLEWDGSTLTKLAGVSTLVVAGSAGAGETAFRVSGGNLQAIVDTGTRNVSSGFSVRH